MKQLKKTILTLVALLALTTGAWADETLLTTITATAQEQASYSTANVATVSFSYTTDGSSAYLANWGWWGYGWSATVTAAEGYTITKCIFYDDANRTATDSEAPFVVETTDEDKTPRINGTPIDGGNMQSKGLKKIEVYGYVTPAASSGPEVAWDEASKTGTFKMPGGNVTLEPEYYPQATLAFKGLTAAEDAAAKTDAPLAVLADGAVTGGTLMYYVATDKNFSQADAIALAETAWSADIPTAETVEAAGTCYVWYYIKGDAEHSDTDPVPLAVTLLPEPTYAVTFAEGTDLNEWTADPNTGVTKGQQVTVTYTGSKKVLGVKAEKKAAPAATISFTVMRATAGGNNSVTYTVDAGTTWQQFIESGNAPASLSIGTYGIYSGKICHDMDDGLTCCGGTLIANVADKKRVKASDAIIDGATYGCSDYLGYQDHD